jgi:hypothetical protein
MQAWEEAKNSGELDSDSDSSDDEDELTGIELLRDLDPPAPCPPADAIPAARNRPTSSRALRPRSSGTSIRLTGT